MVMVGLALDLLFIVLVISSSCTLAEIFDSSFGPTTSQIIELRGFRAITHYICTSDGYSLELIEIDNPKVNSSSVHKDPVLLIHGILANANSFIVNSLGAHPEDFSARIAADMSAGDLLDLVGDNPNSKSIAFSLANWGHRTFLLNKRGAGGSVRRCGSYLSNRSRFQNMKADLREWWSGGRRSLFGGLGLVPSTLGSILNFVSSAGSHSDNEHFWNYSLDDQASRDIREVVEYILVSSGKPKISMVGHSAGAALILMALSSFRDLNSKINKAILWAPALNLDKSDLSPIQDPVEPLLRSYYGPVPPLGLTAKIKQSLTRICHSSAACSTVVDMLAGKTEGQNHDELLPQVIDQTGSHEIVSLLQSIREGLMLHYDYLDPKRNEEAYGQSDPPAYDTTKITSDLSIWLGNKDMAVPPSCAASLMKNLPATSEFHILGNHELLWNHFSFFLHKQVATNLTLPCLQILDRAAR